MLFKKYNVTEIDYLKIDTEGYDTKIMFMYINYIKKDDIKAKKSSLNLVDGVIKMM